MTVVLHFVEKKFYTDGERGKIMMFTENMFMGECIKEGNVAKLLRTGFKFHMGMNISLVKKNVNCQVFL